MQNKARMQIWGNGLTVAILNKITAFDTTMTSWKKYWQFSLKLQGICLEG